MHGGQELRCAYRLLHSVSLDLRRTGPTESFLIPTLQTVPQRCVVFKEHDYNSYPWVQSSSVTL
jgi:hypothetical protein